MTVGLLAAIAEITGCHRITDEDGEWCETHSADWPCKVGQVQRLIGREVREIAVAIDGGPAF